MKEPEKRMPLSTVALVFGGISIPLAFAGHLCSLAAVFGFYGIGIGFWCRWKASKHFLRYTPGSVRRARIGLVLSAIGTGCALLMWALWASNLLLN
ncbi:MAG: hypothetical protein IPJ85_13265 [Flavobacteriales bacterium]|nr:hypothetical protein [Flavobacteriales bacterium]